MLIRGILFMDLIEKAKKHWFVVIISISIVCISITWVVAIEILVKPRDFIIEQQEKRIGEMYPFSGNSVKTGGKINRPYADESVTLEFSVEVEIIRYNPNKYYYIVNEVDELYWPKFQINPSLREKYRKIRGLIVEAGDPPGGIFHLALIEVDETEHQEIRKWFVGIRSTGIQRVGNVLHRIKLKLK